MGGKITGAIAAIAVSSASASVVGVVYTGLGSVGLDFRSVFGFADSAERAPLEAGVVLDASKGHVTSLPDLKAESDGPRCQDVKGSGGCILVSPDPDLKLKFFGYTVSLPADWYGLDGGDDAYRAGDKQQFSFIKYKGGSALNGDALNGDALNGNALSGSVFGNSPNSNALNGDASSRNNQTDVAETAQTVETPYFSGSNNLPSISIPPGYSIVVGEAPLGEFQPPATPNAAFNPGASGSSGAVPSIPEPSTWAMMLAGFAGLGYAALRRASASRPPQRRPC